MLLLDYSAYVRQVHTCSASGGCLEKKIYIIIYIICNLSNFSPPRRFGVVYNRKAVGVLIFRWRANARRGKFTSRRRRRSAVSRHFRRHRLYDRRIYKIVGLYTWKLLTYARRTYVRTPRVRRGTDITRAGYDMEWNEME